VLFESSSSFSPPASGTSAMRRLSRRPQNFRTGRDRAPHVKSNSLNDRFVIALHSPDGNLQTTLPVDRE
jgi:hypothetical protein